MVTLGFPTSLPLIFFQTLTFVPRTSIKLLQQGHSNIRKCLSFYWPLSGFPCCWNLLVTLSSPFWVLWAECVPHPSKSTCRNPEPQRDISRWEVGGHEGGAFANGISVLTRRHTFFSLCSPSSCEGTRRQLHANHKEGPHRPWLSCSNFILVFSASNCDEQILLF
jgi:hypothetical protein